MTDKGEITPTETAPNLFNKLLKENKLTVSISTPNVRTIDGGGLIIEKPSLIVGYADGRKT